MNIKAVFASTLIFYSCTFGMNNEPETNYQKWKNESLRKCWIYGVTRPRFYIDNLETKLPITSIDGIKFHTIQNFCCTSKGNDGTLCSVTYPVMTHITWPRSLNQNGAFTYSSLFFHWDKSLRWIHDTCPSPLFDYIFFSSEEYQDLKENIQKQYCVTERKNPNFKNGLVFDLTDNNGNVVIANALSDTKDYSWHQIETCNKKLLLCTRYEHQTNDIEVIMMNPYAEYDGVVREAFVILHDTSLECVYKNVKLFFEPEGTYILVLIDCPEGIRLSCFAHPNEGIMFDHNFAKLENTHFNFK